MYISVLLMGIYWYSLLDVRALFEAGEAFRDGVGFVNEFANHLFCDVVSDM